MQTVYDKANFSDRVARAIKKSIATASEKQWREYIAQFRSKSLKQKQAELDRLGAIRALEVVLSYMSDKE